MIQMDELSHDQQKAIGELRMRTKNILKPEMYEDILLFYRFLKARDFDVDEAENMLRKHMVWRKLYQIDTILEDFHPKEILVKHVSPSEIGADKDGCLVEYNPTGKLDTREILRCVTMNHYMKYVIWFAEKLKKREKQLNEITGKNAHQIVLILDLDKLSFGNATSKVSTEIMLHLTNVYQNNYPEYMKATYVINAPAYYVILYTILKAVMSSAMIRKIHVFGHSGWKEKLLEVIDADVLPAFLGGNRTDPDGDLMCRSFVNHGGAIPPSYFISDEERYFIDKTGVTKLVVPNMKKKTLCVEVKELESLIRWEFYTKNNIGFGLFYQTPEQELEEVIPIMRYDTSDGMAKGSYKAKSSGKYIIVFDNTYSWLSSKEVEYCIEVMKHE